MDQYEELAEIISLLQDERSRLNGEAAGMAYNSEGSEISIDYIGFNRPSEY
jgi:hypothetical protein